MIKMAKPQMVILFLSHLQNMDNTLFSHRFKKLMFRDFVHSAAKQQISLWRSPLTFIWPGIPEQLTTIAPSRD